MERGGGAPVGLARTASVNTGEKHRNGEDIFLSFFSLMKRSKNQPTEHNLLKISH
jgi:hypothetical protein